MTISFYATAERDALPPPRWEFQYEIFSEVVLDTRLSMEQKTAIRAAIKGNEFNTRRPLILLKQTACLNRFPEDDALKVELTEDNYGSMEERFDSIMAENNIQLIDGDGQLGGHSAKGVPSAGAVGIKRGRDEAAGSGDAVWGMGDAWCSEEDDSEEGDSEEGDSEDE